jgi:hypothetical protein
VRRLGSHLGPEIPTISAERASKLRGFTPRGCSGERCGISPFGFGGPRWMYVRLQPHNGLRLDITPRQLGLQFTAKKNRPKAALQFEADDRRSSGHQCWLVLPAISHEADASEAEDHHRPCRGLGNSANVDRVVKERCRPRLIDDLVRRVRCNDV